MLRRKKTAVVCIRCTEETKQKWIDLMNEARKKGMDAETLFKKMMFYYTRFGTTFDVY